MIQLETTEDNLEHTGNKNTALRLAFMLGKLKILPDVEYTYDEGDNQWEWTVQGPSATFDFVSQIERWAWGHEQNRIIRGE